LQDTKRTINLHLTAAASRVLPYALAAEELSFSAPDVERIAGEFAAKAEQKKVAAQEEAAQEAAQPEAVRGDAP
jgi:hypothetical protein